MQLKLSLVVLVAFVGNAQAQTLELKGFVPGVATRSEIDAATDYNFRCRHFSDQGYVFDSCIAAETVTLAGQTLNQLRVYLYDDIVSDVFAYFPPLYVQYIKDALTKKYGTPETTKLNVQNGFGVTLDKEIYAWNDGERSLVLHSMGETQDVALIRLYHLPTIIKQEEAAAAAASEAIDDL